MLYNSTCPMTVAYDTETTERNYRTYLKSRFCFSLSVSSAISTGMLKPQNFATKMSKIITVRQSQRLITYWIILDHVATGYLVPAICMLARTLGRWNVSCPYVG
jgi:hypothetical protein